MDQLGHRIDHAATTQIITVDGNTKIPIGEIDNFPFEINEIQIPTKETTGCQKPTLLLTGTPKNFNLYSTDSMPEFQLHADILKPNVPRNPLLNSKTHQCHQPSRPIRLDGYPHDDHEIWRIVSAKAEDATPEEIREIKDNPWTPKYNGPNYSKDDFFTDNPDTFQN
ncbi:hypothetical protein G9A89_017597 [Geosiphon pyriformis]|nr:hypothetical protein G9A89_017597 [Geosiphon pyriformis]